MDIKLDDIKESIEQGVEQFKSDMAFTKESYDQVVADKKAEKAAKKAEKKQEREDMFEGVTGFIEKSVESLGEAVDIAKGKNEDK